MGKILESLGIIDGFKLTQLGKLKAKKDEIFEELEKLDSNIKEETRQVLEEKGSAAFTVVKDGIIYGIYLFKEEKVGEDEKNLILVKKLFSDEVTEKARTTFDDKILEIAKENVAYMEYDKVVLEDEEVKTDPSQSKKEKVAGFVGGFIVGFVLGWTCFGEAYMGVLFGIIFAPLFGGAVVVTSNNKEKKDDTDKKDS